MDVFQHVLTALATIAQPINIAMLVGGVVFGSVFGILPGVSVLTAVILVLPLTYSLGGETSVILILGIYVAGIFAGSSTSILFNIPGDPQNAPTTFDGYPMTRKGLAAKALGMAIISSAVGGLIGCVVLIATSEHLAEISLAFGPAEYFGLIFLGLSVVSGLEAGSYGKALLSALIGLLLASVGVAEVSGESRFTFGFAALNAGINFVPVMIGALAMSEVFEQVGQKVGVVGQYTGRKFRLRDGLPDRDDLRSVLPTWGRCSVLGTLIGALPGAGATIAAFVAYGIEQSVHRRRHKFGTGEIAGVAAPETANNAAGMGTLIPLLALGIPGGGVAAVMFGALEIHGMQPGPLMFLSQPEMVMTIFITALVANGLILAVGSWQARYIVRLLTIPEYLLYPAIAVFCVVGAYAVNNLMFDVWVMLVAGLLGTYLRMRGFSVVAVVLGMVLGPIAENAWVQGTIMFGSPAAFLLRPLSGTMIVLGAIFLLMPLITRWIRPLRLAMGHAPFEAKND